MQKTTSRSSQNGKGAEFLSEIGSAAQKDILAQTKKISRKTIVKGSKILSLQLLQGALFVDQMTYFATSRSESKKSTWDASTALRTGRQYRRHPAPKGPPPTKGRICAEVCPLKNIYLHFWSFPI